MNYIEDVLQLIEANPDEKKYEYFERKKNKCSKLKLTNK